MISTFTNRAWTIFLNEAERLKTFSNWLLVGLLLTPQWVLAEDTADSSSWPLERKPRWEAGLGGGYIEGFDYPASAQNNYFGGLLPFVVYRSEKLRFTGRGISAIALEDSRFKLDVSMAVSLNADSEGNTLRAGMPDLDYLFELGPQLVMRVIDSRSESGRTRLNWSNRLRGVVSTDFGSLNGRGWVLQSQFQWRRENLFRNKLDLFATLSFTWASENLQDYFYQVGADQTTSFRPAYDASGGYLSTTLFAGFGWSPVQDIRLFVGINQGHFGNSANKESPLFETDASTGIALGLVWTIAKSPDTVLVLNDE